MTQQELLRYIEDMKIVGVGSRKKNTFRMGSSLLGVNGTVSGYFARYDRVADSYGDVCAPGFLSKSIKKRAEIGKPFALVYNHDLDQIIGAVVDIEEKPDGVFMTAQFFDTPRAQEIRELVKAGVLYQMSFSYTTEEKGRVTLPDGSKANELRKCTLYEISIVPIPAQPLSVITDVKGTKKPSKAELEKKKNEILKTIEKYKNQRGPGRRGGGANKS